MDIGAAPSVGASAVRSKFASLCLAALGFATLFSAGARAEVRKTAFIVVNWAAPAFANEARAASTQLQKMGWEVHLFDNVAESDGLTISQKVDGKTVTYACVKGKMCGWQKIIAAFLPQDSVRAGDQILVDIHAHFPQCYPKEPSRKIPRDIHERAHDFTRFFVGTEGFELPHADC